jgi:tRNA G37 N-methylase Trm5
MAKVPGTKLELRGEEFEVTPLTAADLEDMESQVQRIIKLNDYPVKEDWQAIGDLLFASLQVNHPSISRDQVRKLIDSGNFRRVIHALIFAALSFPEASEAKPGEPARPQS